ncbi:MAG: hypothetical protein B7C24_11945 [Bacteroidetes bacterium 4572_77]|nr:MAG: hypothetical protein B7C24_11945 [Bacteroidetes bacterium 4572_77]
MNKLLLTCTTFFIIASAIIAQNNQKNDTANYPYWIEMMQDETANFYDVQNAFNTYWEGKTPSKSSGWKIYKRWEYQMLFKIDEQGFRLSTKDIHNKVSAFQKKNRNTKSSANWLNLGPIDLPENTGTGQPNGMGRINAIAFHPDNEDIIFIGAPQGGLWKSTDGGQSWTVLTDSQPTLGVSSIIINQADPEIILIGSGDRDAGDSDGMGVFKSTDGGNTWQSSNDGMGNHTVGRMIQDPDNDQIILAATSGGIYKSTDLGDTWTSAQSGNFKDLLFKPNNSDVVYAITANNFYKSTNNGDSFVNSSSGLPGGSRGGIAVSPADPERVYVLLSSGSVFGSVSESTDAGENWTVKSTSPNIFDYSCDGGGTSGQGWYDMDIAIDPNNADFVFVGGVNTWVSTDAGSNWQIKSHWYGSCSVDAVHADMHVFEINPLNNRLYNGNDGGLYYTDNNGNDWTQISNGLAISQIYKIGSSATVRELVINGYQDNGTATFTSEGWKTVMGGDGMDCVIDWEDPNYSYGEYYYGNIDRIYNNANNQGSVVNGISEDGAWVTPFTLSHADANIMFVGMKGVWRSTNIKASSTSQIQWTQISDFNGSNCNLLVQSDANADILFVGKGGNLKLCINANAESPSWESIGGLPGNGDINSIATDPNNENRIFMARGNGIFYSDDLCESWTDISGNLPSIPMRSIVYYKNSVDGLYVGAQAGVYYKDPSLSDWVLFNDDLPLSSVVTELEIFYDGTSPSGDRLRASTYGRGLWETTMYQGVLSADFEGDQTTIPSGCTVQFTDLTTGVPQNWNWTFEGGTPASSTQQHPEVVYETNGTYNVSLEVTNDNGSDNISKENYITVDAGLVPEVHFMADKQYFCTDEEMLVHFMDESLHCPTAWLWSFSPNNVTYLDDTDEQSQNPVVEFTQNGSYHVTLEVSNSNGTSSHTAYQFIKTGGKVGLFMEDFEDGNALNRGWSIVNDDGGTTWEEGNAAGNGGEKAMLMNFRNYTNFGARDRLISPLIELDASLDGLLSFEHAYAKYYDAYTDSLIVYISTDCGESWNRLMQAGEDGNGSFATHERTTQGFIPSGPEDWCSAGFGPSCYDIDLSAYKGEEFVKIAFESYNMRGNGLYIDLVKVDYAEAIPENHAATASIIHLSPNPNHGEFEISFSQEMTNATLEVFNPLGQLVYMETLKSSNTQSSKKIHLKQYTTGVYMLKIKHKDGEIQKKFVVE